LGKIQDYTVGKSRGRNVEKINREYRNYERGHSLNSIGAEETSLHSLNQLLANEGEGTAYINQLDDGSILNTHVLPGRKVMFYNNKIHELVNATEWISYFQRYIDRRFYRRLQSFPSSNHPQELYDIIRENKSLIEKRYVSRILNKLQTTLIKLEGNYYFPITLDNDNSEEVPSLYKKLIEKEIKLRAVEHNEFQTIQMYEISKQREQLARIANLEKFDLNGAGFERRESVYYAYVTTTPYALKSPHIDDERKYLPMPPAKIGVSITYSQYGQGQFIIGKPVVMNMYKHPFLPQRAEMQGICLGQYHLDYRSFSSPEESVMNLLSKAKEIILMGYRTGSNPYVHLHKSNWRGWITKEEVQERGLVCLNDFSRR
jgi:hypothetical protein